MNPVWTWILGVIGPIIAGLAMWTVNRSVGRVDALEKRCEGLDRRLHEFELQIAKELATKEDVRDVKRDLEAAVSTLHEIRDMVIRLEERNKSNG